MQHTAGWAGLGAGLLFFLAGCSVPQVADYRMERPAIDIVSYFSGDVDGSGMFQDRSGRVVKRFHVAMHGEWHDGELVLQEHFVYSDGSLQQRVWHIQRGTGASVLGTAGDVVGVAHGEQAGNALHWVYDLELPVGTHTLKVAMNDWMFQQDQSTVLDITDMSWWGIHLGHLTLVMHRRGASACSCNH